VNANRSIFVIVALGSLLWGMTLRNGFVWDDAYYVLTNPAIRSWRLVPVYFTDCQTTAGRQFGAEFAVFRPLRNISYLLDFKMAGYRPVWWHAHNAALHILGAVLVLLLCRRLVASEWAALGGALLFLTHPVQTETVAWVKGRDDLISVVLSLATILLWLRWRPALSLPRRSILAALTFLACLAKLQAVVLPAVFVAGEWLLPTDAPSPAQRFRRALGTAALPLLAALVFLCWRHKFIGQTAQCGYLAGSLYPTLLTMTDAAVGYLRLILWPARLVADYSGMTPIHSAATLHFWINVSILAAAAVPVLLLVRRRPVARCGLVWFGICMLPVSNLVPMMQYMAERFLYLPLIGISLIAADALSRLRRGRAAAAVGATVLIIALTARTAWRIPDWKNEETLFAATIRDTPPSAMRPRNNYLVHLINEGRFSEAMPLATSLLAQATGTADASSWRAVYTRHVGFIQCRLGAMAEGTARLLQAADLDPAYAQPCVDLGILAGRAGQHTQALQWFDKAVARGPESSVAHFNRGIALQSLGRTAEAENELRQSIRCGAESPDVYKSLAALLWSTGRIAPCIPIYREAAAMWPDDREIRVWLARALELNRSARRTQPNP
jgi:protein O-mannosyl-transferase